VVVANSKCLQDRLVAINRQAQNSQKWPRLHHLLRAPLKHRLMPGVVLRPDPLEVDLQEIIHSILRWDLHHT
jgi:hypothetical protein